MLGPVPGTAGWSWAAQGTTHQAGHRARAPGECGDWQLLEGTKGRQTQLEFPHPPLQVWCVGGELFLPLLWLQQEGRMDLTAAGALPALPMFSFLSISRAATGPCSEVPMHRAVWLWQEHLQFLQGPACLVGGWGQTVECRHCENSSASPLTLLAARRAKPAAGQGGDQVRPGRFPAPAGSLSLSCLSR